MRVLGPKHTILVVEDDKAVRFLIAEALKPSQAQVITASGGIEAYTIVQERHVSAVVSDINMSGGGGLELLRLIKRINPLLPVLLLSGYETLREQAHFLGADAVFSKPLSLPALLQTLDHLLSPPRQRWSGIPERQIVASSVLREQPQVGDPDSPLIVSLGRGGFFVPGSFTARPGQFVRFHVETDDSGEIFSGLGIVRWERTEAEDDALPGLGVEILNLDTQYLARASTLLESVRSSAYIPRT